MRSVDYWYISQGQDNKFDIIMYRLGRIPNSEGTIPPQSRYPPGNQTVSSDEGNGRKQSVP